MLLVAESSTCHRRPLVAAGAGLVLMWLVCGSITQAHGAAERQLSQQNQGDAILEAMESELTRSMMTLGRAGPELAPYFIAYTAKEQTEYVVQGKLGGIQLDDTSRQRRARVEVRVGSVASDSTEDKDPAWPYEESYEPSAVLPLENHIPALRHTYWLLTDLGYKQAMASYFKLMAQKVYRAARKDKRGSFSSAPLVKDLQSLPPIHFDRSVWRAVVKAIGETLSSHSELFDHAVDVMTQRVVRWHVNSEGTRLRTAHLLYEIHVQGWIRAQDGMLLQDSIDFYAPKESDLPTVDALVVQAHLMAQRLMALAAAPELGPYTGPAILGPRAAGVFFHEVLGHRLEGHRQDDADEGQTFADHLERTIMPTFLSVRDDPRPGAFGSVHLNGTYTYDEEGVKAQAVTLVDHGVLKAFLMSRRPAPGLEGTNGHARAQGLLTPTARMGNLIVESHKSVSPEKLKRMLLSEARRQKKPYGLIIRDISGGSTNTSSYGYQAFKGQARVVYRLDAKTGRETLVRGVDLVGTPLVSISKIMAAGDQQGVFNGYCGAESGMVPVSTVAPAILFREVELQRSVNERAKPPLLPAPLEGERP
jgi:TldD protein